MSKLAAAGDMITTSPGAARSYTVSTISSILVELSCTIGVLVSLAICSATLAQLAPIATTVRTSLSLIT